MNSAAPRVPLGSTPAAASAETALAADSAFAPSSGFGDSVSVHPAALPGVAGALDPMPGTQIDHLRALFQQTPASLTGNAIGMALIAAMYASLEGAAPVTLWPWLGVGLVLWGLRLAHYLRYRARPDAPDELLRGWRRSWRVLVLMQGGMWGVAAWAFWGLGTTYHTLALILIVYSYCLGSVQLLATQPRVFLAFISLVLTPTILRIATDTSHPWHWQLAGILTLLFCITVLMARTYGSALGQAITLKARTDELAASLRHEMAAADEARRHAEAARRAAEAASLAKTQFFAAASHDLRQPLHAMGLFAEALRQRTQDSEVAGLVNSINESVDALEGLFGELLDITRIDSGGVAVNPQPLRMRDLFARLRLHFEPVAFEKGLVLGFRGERHVAHADPVLVERILRNLVSNAIRYTDDGGVIVSCRSRGTRLLVQVWDTGIGISEQSLPRIFDEFYQVQSARRLEAHQRKGLGLGLAIVKRLAALMDTPIDVRSRVGRGTVFGFDLPVGRAPLTDTPGSSGTKAPLGLTLNGVFVVVVEDEAAVREGLVVLLKAWGASVVAFDTVDAVRGWVGSPEAAQRRPDLLLVDYRLPQGQTGIHALVALRARWAEAKLPAIVITGSSLVGHEDEAVTHDYHLLIKPVLPNKLRAMVAFKLGVR
jgi:signal transduction histidine kinase/CheY-like chemotaxis protein